MSDAAPSIVASLGAAARFFASPLSERRARRGADILTRWLQRNRYL
jgi:hypothetical protein